MSKFEVGDEVRVVRGAGGHLPDGSRWTVIGADGEYVNLVSLDGGTKKPGWHESRFVPADPSVPDVDGNPIRVGALVEYVPAETVARVERLYDDEDDVQVRFSRSDLVDCEPHHLRVLTADDLHRPPAPATRDVTLRVVVRNAYVPWRDDSIASGAHRALTGRSYFDIDPDGVTVEVIEDGDSQ